MFPDPRRATTSKHYRPIMAPARRNERHQHRCHNNEPLDSDYYEDYLAYRRMFMDPSQVNAWEQFYGNGRDRQNQHASSRVNPTEHGMFTVNQGGRNGGSGGRSGYGSSGRGGNEGGRNGGSGGRSGYGSSGRGGQDYGSDGRYETDYDSDGELFGSNNPNRKKLRNVDHIPDSELAFYAAQNCLQRLDMREYDTPYVPDDINHRGSGANIHKRPELWSNTKQCENHDLALMDDRPKVVRGAFTGQQSYRRDHPSPVSEAIRNQNGGGPTVHSREAARIDRKHKSPTFNNRDDCRSCHYY